MMQPQDVQRLIQIIVEELAAAQAAPAPARCACHALTYECCPDRVAGVLGLTIMLVIGAGTVAFAIYQLGSAVNAVIQRFLEG